MLYEQKDLIGQLESRVESLLQVFVDSEAASADSRGAS